MEYLDTDLGHQNAGAVVTVTLSGTEANVMLLDQSNFQNYQAGRGFQYAGGHYKRSPVRLAVPHSGHWHCVVDLGGASGQVRATVTVAPA